MAIPTLPVSGSTSWFSWAQGVDSAVRSQQASALNVKDYGALGDGTTDDTAAIGNAISAASTAGGGVVYFPAGTYIADGIVMRHHVTLRGAGMKTTRLKPKVGGSATGLILLNQGYAQQAFLEDFELVGSGNIGQHAVHMVATGIAPFNNGGWWQSGMRRVDISGFDGHAVFLKGGGGVGYTALLPHQFLVFEQVYAFAKTGYNALRTEGQVGQVEFIGCQFDGPGVAADTVPNVSIQGGAYLLNFRGCTFQSRRVGILVDAAATVHFDNCYFEALGFALTAQNPGAGISVSGGVFGNAAQVGDGTGYIFRALDNGGLVAEGSMLINGVTENGAQAANNGAMSLHGILHNAATFSTSGNTRQIGVNADNSVNLFQPNTTYLVNSSATAIQWIGGSPYNAGDVVYLRAHSGSIVLASGGHIELGGRTSPVTVPASGVVTLVKFDLGPTWALASVSA